MHETALNANISHLSSKYCICLTSNSGGRILSAFALVPLSNESTKGLVCVAWRFSNFSKQIERERTKRQSRENEQEPSGSSRLRRIWRSLSRLRRFLSAFKLPKNAKLRRPLNDVQSNPQQLHDD